MQTESLASRPAWVHHTLSLVGRGHADQWVRRRGMDRQDGFVPGERRGLGRQGGS